MSLIRRAVLRALVAPSLRRYAVTTPIATTRVTAVAPAQPCTYRWFHQTRATSAEFDGEETVSDSLSRATNAASTSHIDVDRRSVFVSNLLYDITEEDLREEFGKIGPVEAVKIVNDDRGLSKGFSFVTFQKAEDATMAIESLHGTVYQGRRLVVASRTTRIRPVSVEQRPPENPPSKTLFVGNMPFQMTDRDMNDLFGECQNILDVRVAIDRRSGQPRGFAHADFVDVESARNARELLEAKVVYGRQLRVNFGSNNFGSRRRAPSWDQEAHETQRPSEEESEATIQESEAHTQEKSQR